MRQHHDMGGLPAGPLDRSEHTYAPWEKRTHALLVLLAEPCRAVMSVDELRRGIETLGEQEYDRLGYYERWIMSIAANLIHKGVITVDELGRKLVEIEAREGGA
jgi:Nitrile hydratase beta subunit